MENHPETGLKFSLPVSADQRELPMRPSVQVEGEKVVWQEWGPGALGPHLHVSYQGLLGPNLITHFRLITESHRA